MPTGFRTPKFTASDSIFEYNLHCFNMYRKNLISLNVRRVKHFHEVWRSIFCLLLRSVEGQLETLFGHPRLLCLECHSWRASRILLISKEEDLTNLTMNFPNNRAYIVVLAHSRWISPPVAKIPLIGWLIVDTLACILTPRVPSDLYHLTESQCHWLGTQSSGGIFQILGSIWQRICGYGKTQENTISYSRMWIGKVQHKAWSDKYWID